MGFSRVGGAVIWVSRLHLLVLVLGNLVLVEMGVEHRGVGCIISHGNMYRTVLLVYGMIMLLWRIAVLVYILGYILG